MIALILDTETTGLEDYADVIEVAAVRYDLARKSMVDAWSAVVVSPRPNTAQHINHIPAGLDAITQEAMQSQMIALAESSDVIVAHNAEFDRGKLPWLNQRPWVCSYEHLDWSPKGPNKLSELCLGHGLGVSRAHRALDDVLMLVALFDRRAEWHDLVEWMQQAMEPRLLVIAQLPYEHRLRAKDAGFRWQPDRKQWTRELTQRQIDAQSGAWAFTWRVGR